MLSARLSTVAVDHLVNTIRAQAIIMSPRMANVLGSQQPAKNGAPGTPASAPAASETTIHIIARPFQDDLRGAGDEISNGRVSHAEQKITVCPPGHFDERGRDALILHSSGTTGLPKAIFQSHKYLLGYAHSHIRTDEEDVGTLNMSTLPLYHVSEFAGSRSSA